jgi:hypothetical protein
MPVGGCDHIDCLHGGEGGRALSSSSNSLAAASAKSLLRFISSSASTSSWAGFVFQRPAVAPVVDPLADDDAPIGFTNGSRDDARLRALALLAIVSSSVSLTSWYFDALATSLGFVVAPESWTPGCTVSMGPVVDEAKLASLATSGPAAPGSGAVLGFSTLRRSAIPDGVHR